MANPTPTDLRHDWTLDDIDALFSLPFADLLNKAHQTHRQHFDPNAVQISTLLSIKTGGCPEDCAYCPQSTHYDTGVDNEKMLDVEAVVAAARKAKKEGATRFCMGAAWRGQPREKHFQATLDMVNKVKELGMETCATLGMLDENYIARLKEAGLDYYNHNLDTSPEYYEKIISTRTYDDRLDTLQQVRKAGIKVCCGGIVGMGESRKDRMGLLQQLANLPEHPGSVPINELVRVEGTPLGETDVLDPFEFVRTIAVARIMMPASFVRLSAGREEMNDERQALCFFAGANSIFYGETLLTTPNPEMHKDKQLFDRLGIQPLAPKCHAPVDKEVTTAA